MRRDRRAAIAATPDEQKKAVADVLSLNRRFDRVRDEYRMWISAYRDREHLGVVELFAHYPRKLDGGLLLVQLGYMDASKHHSTQTTYPMVIITQNDPQVSFIDEMTKFRYRIHLFTDYDQAQAWRPWGDHASQQN